MISTLRKFLAPSVALLVVSWLAIGSPPARADTLITLDGKCFEGDSRLLPNGDVLMSQKSGAPVQMSFNNILYALLNSPRPAVAAAVDLGSLGAHSIGDADRDADAFYFRGFYALRGGGAGIDGKADTLRFYSKGFYGNGELTVHLVDVGSASVSAGLMFRDEMDPDAIEVSLLASSKGELALRYRAEAGGKTARIDAGKITFPVYLRLTRSDRQYRGYTSTDGTKWDLAVRLYDDSKAEEPDAKPRGVGMDTGTLVGFALAGGTTDAPATAMFEQFVSRGLYDTSSVVSAKAAGPAQYSGASLETFRRGVLLRTGAFLANASATLQEGDKIVAARGDAEYVIDRADLAAIRVRDVPSAAVAGLPAHAVGVLLSSGDFMEGEISKFDKDQVEVSNITLGLSTYRLDTKVHAILFRDANTTPAGYRIRLLDGSLLVARSMKVDKDALVIEEYLLGSMRLPVKEILSIQGIADRVQSLLTQRPASVDGRAGMVIEGVTAFDASASLWLSAAGMHFEQGLVSPAGAALTYRLPAGTRTFLARVAVPERLPEKSAVRFVVLADGNEVFRSDTFTSRTPPQFLNVPLGDAKTLTLKVEAASKSELPAFGLWATPMLMR